MRKKLAVKVLAIALLPVFAVGTASPQTIVKIVHLCCGLPCPSSVCPLTATK